MADTLQGPAVLALSWGRDGAHPDQAQRGRAVTAGRVPTPSRPLCPSFGYRFLPVFTCFIEVRIFSVQPNTVYLHRRVRAAALLESAPWAPSCTQLRAAALSEGLSPAGSLRPPQPSPWDPGSMHPPAPARPGSAQGLLSASGPSAPLLGAAHGSVGREETYIKLSLKARTRPQGRRLPGLWASCLRYRRRGHSPLCEECSARGGGLGGVSDACLKRATSLDHRDGRQTHPEGVRGSLRSQDQTADQGGWAWPGG